MTTSAPPNSGIPTPVQGVTGGEGLPPGSAFIDPISGSIVLSPSNNVVQIRKGANAQALQLYEFFTTNAIYSRLGLNTQANGPFIIRTESQPAVVRQLNIVANGTLFFEGQDAPQGFTPQRLFTMNGTWNVTGSDFANDNGNLAVWSSYADALLANTSGSALRFTAASTSGQPAYIQSQSYTGAVKAPLRFSSDNSFDFMLSLLSFSVPQWSFDVNGFFVPGTTNVKDIGSATAAIRSIYVGTSNQFAGASALRSGVGVPGAGLGANGDFYFNQTGGALTTIYQKRAGAWVGIV